MTSDSYVAAGVILDTKGNILVSQRLKHAHQGGLWEFPGGKCEQDETIFQALQRELKEELSISVRQAYPLIKIAHDYEDLSVLLDVWVVTVFDGTPKSCEGQNIKWVNKSELRQLEMPAADIPIVQAVNLPEYYAIAPEPKWLLEACQQTDERIRNAAISRYVNDLENTLSNGIHLVQLRLKILSEAGYAEIVRACKPVCEAHDCRLLLNSDIDTAVSLGVSGVHLDGRKMKALGKLGEDELERLQQSFPRDFLVSASCHDVSQLELAKQIGVKFAVLSPVLKTKTHPDANALGWDAFEELVSHSNMPVYALGGMSREHLRQARERGAQGISAISGLWKACE